MNETITSNSIVLGDCLEQMERIPSASVDIILADLPYGSTRCAWDTCIDLPSLWAAFHRITKPGAPIVLHAAQPFTSVLISSNLRDFRYTWSWVKNKATGYLNARRQPLRSHEDVAVFWRGPQGTYNPRMAIGPAYSNAHKPGDSGDCYGKVGYSSVTDRTTRYPRTSIYFPVDMKPTHPTQKPLALARYFIETYSNPGDVVLDCCAGSGTTAVAAVNTRRRYIAIERDIAYHAIAEERVADALRQAATEDAQRNAETMFLSTLPSPDSGPVLSDSQQTA